MSTHSYFVFPFSCSAAAVTADVPHISPPLCTQAFESTLKSWEDKRKIDSYRSARPRLNSQQSMEYLTEEECAQVQQLGIVADTLINKYVTQKRSRLGLLLLDGVSEKYYNSSHTSHQIRKRRDGMEIANEKTLQSVWIQDNSRVCLVSFILAVHIHPFLDFRPTNAFQKKARIVTFLLLCNDAIPSHNTSLTYWQRGYFQIWFCPILPANNTGSLSSAWKTHWHPSKRCLKGSLCCSKISVNLSASTQPRPIGLLTLLDFYWTKRTGMLITIVVEIKRTLFREMYEIYSGQTS